VKSVTESYILVSMPLPSVTYIQGLLKVCCSLTTLPAATFLVHERAEKWICILVGKSEVKRHLSVEFRITLTPV
jgi:hypothetical protein